MAIMEMGPAHLKASSHRLEKQGIKPAMPGLQGEWFIHYATVTQAPVYIIIISDFHPIRECNIYFIIPYIRSFIFYRLKPTVVRGVPKGK